VNLAQSKSPGAITPIPRPLTRTVPTLTLSDHTRSRPAPSILGQNHMHIAAESIYAVFEVKPTISRQQGTGCSCGCARKEWIRDAAEKAATVRALRLYQHARRVVDLFSLRLLQRLREMGTSPADLMKYGRSLRSFREWRRPTARKPGSPRHPQTALSSRAQRGISFCERIRRGAERHSEMHRVVPGELRIRQRSSSRIWPWMTYSGCIC
jgi:hypothetical protein